MAGMATEDRGERPQVIKPPPAARGKGRRHQKHTAEDQFARTFADVLSGRFGDRWVVEWEGPDRSALSTDGDRRTFPGEE